MPAILFKLTAHLQSRSQHHSKVDQTQNTEALRAKRGQNSAKRSLILQQMVAAVGVRCLQHILEKMGLLKICQQKQGQLRKQLTKCLLLSLNFEKLKKTEILSIIKWPDPRRVPLNTDQEERDAERCKVQENQRITTETLNRAKEEKFFLTAAGCGAPQLSTRIYHLFLYGYCETPQEMLHWLKLSSQSSVQKDTK